MSLFTISDLHLSLHSDKSMEVFEGWQDYVKRIQKNWNAVVGNDDTVVIPGDVSWAMKLEDTKKDFEFLNNLNGKKILVKGNHDYWWDTLTKMKAYLEKENFLTISFLYNNSYSADGFALCGTRGWMIEESGTDSKFIKREAARLKASLESAKQFQKPIVVFLHYPPVSAEQTCKEIVDVLNEYDVKRVYYGHIHGYSKLRAIEGEHENIKYKLVSCDSIDFTPLLIK
ncbi:MAG: metallophosphoesterase [Acutalibacteraceae bacterium]|nr:metallophosphoesterase [Acutalibacteraceae bacterium]